MLCLAILRLLQQNSSTAPLPARNFADLLAHLVASLVGEEAKEQSDLHILNPAVHAQPDLLTFCTSEHRKHAVIQTSVIEP